MKHATTLILIFASTTIAFAQQSNSAVPDSGVSKIAIEWRATEPLLAVDQDRLPASPDNPWLAVKDPTIVHHDNRWHLFCTLRKRDGGNGKPPGYIRVGYLSFEKWEDAPKADWTLLELSMGYHGAPQVFYFEPQKKWYLVYQLEDEKRGISFGPCFSTTTNIADPGSWTLPKPFYDEKPSTVKGWLDFWVICDEKKAHLFFTSLNGKLWRAETALEKFPHGFTDPQVALTGKFFEASHVYRLKGTEQYLMLIEAQKESGRKGHRFYKAWISESLDGKWVDWVTTADEPFAGTANVTMPESAWTDSISHGELIRVGIDQHLEVDPTKLRFLFQGLTDDQWGKGYGKLGWRLGMLEAK